MDIWQVSVEGYPHTRAFDNVALCLRESIRELGFESEITTKAPSLFKNNIVLGAHILNIIGGLTQGDIIYNLEQITPESPLINERYIERLRKHRVWDYSRRNIVELGRLGIHAEYMPIGYHPIMGKIPEWYLQQMDCLFYGSVNERRKKIVGSVDAHNIFGIYGEELDTVIASSKVILNCHYYETKLFEIVRCSYLMANRKFILSEPGLDEDLEAPFREGIAFHSKEEWPEAVKYYLAHPEVREKIANKGFEIFSNMKQVDYLRNESKSW